MKKNHVGLQIEKNSFVDEGDGVVSFPKGLVITDNSEQRNGTRYDIKSMDLSEYNGHLTADHVDMLNYIIGKVSGVTKKANKIVIDQIKFAVKESALGRLSYDLLRGGFLTDFSIETYGSAPDEEGVYKESKLIGLSAVVVGNNRSAQVNELVHNSIEKSKEDGLDTEDLEEKLLTDFKINKYHKTDDDDLDEDDTSKDDVMKNTNKEKEDMKFLTIKNSRDFPVVLTYKNASGEDTETTVPANGSVDVSEDQKDVVEKQVTDAVAPKTDAEVAAEKKAEEDKEKEANSFADIAKMVNAMNDRFTKFEQTAFDKKVEEPKFKKDSNGIKDTKNEYASMDWQDRHAKQINAAWDLLKRHDGEAAVVLNKINEVNLAKLKSEGVVKNSMTIGDFGNFIISREMLTEIEGYRNDYTSLLNATSWKETLATQMAWITRQGDISMDEVEFCDDGDDGNLKPISEYGATVDTANLHELAAVTPVCNAATRFLAVDLLGDVAAGYRNDYDRKRAQLVVARLEQALESHTSNSVIYDTNPAVDALVSLLSAWSKIAQSTPNGTFILNTQSYASILGYALRAGVSGPLSQIFTTGDQPRMFGRPYIIVSNDLMPSLDTASTVTLQVEGQAVVVNHAVFYADLTKFTGRTSGGLQYDLSTEAAYEDGGQVKSAYQRNELVLRGSFFRGGAITDPTRVSGILAPGVS